MQMFDIPHFYQWLHFTKLDPALELLQVWMHSQGQSIPSVFGLEKKVCFQFAHKTPCCWKTVHICVIWSFDLSHPCLTRVSFLNKNHFCLMLLIPDAVNKTITFQPLRNWELTHYGPENKILSFNWPWWKWLTA